MALLFCFVWVAHLEDIDVEGLLVLAHIAQYDCSRFVESGI